MNLRNLKPIAFSKNSTAQAGNFLSERGSSLRSNGNGPYGRAEGPDLNPRPFTVMIE